MKAHLFYVEDDETLAFLTKDNLEQKDYTVSHYSDGANAWQHFKESDFDLCILDVMLPNIDGFTLAKQIRSINDSIPIIFLTAKNLREDKLEGLGLGGDDYLTKPFSIEELILKIEIFLRRKNVVAPSDNEVYKISNSIKFCLLYTSPSPRDRTRSRMPSSA